jgi:response regulator NasT
MNRFKVLLIEDNPIIMALESSLKQADFNYFKTPFDLTFLKLTKEIRPHLIILNVDTPSKSLLETLLTLNQHSPFPVLMFCNDANEEIINQVIQADVSAFIINGFEPNRLQALINIALARFKQQQTLKTALEEACAKLEDRKLTDRAKAILIKTQNFSEDEAYHTLRKLAMDRKITLGEMAKNVIAMSELFK